jgi:hypothetical protein
MTAPLMTGERFFGGCFPWDLIPARAVCGQWFTVALLEREAGYSLWAQTLWASRQLIREREGQHADGS